MIETGKIIAHGGLHLREKADPHSVIRALLPYGTVVTIDRHEGNWLFVKYNFKEGYLYKPFVKLESIPVPDLDPPHLQSWPKTALVLAIAIIAAIIAFSYGSFGWHN